MTRTQLLATREWRDVANGIRRNCRGTSYTYSAASAMRHKDCAMEINFSNIYTCHTCLVQGIH